MATSPTNGEKAFATRALMIYRLLMATRNSKANKLDDLLGDLTVEEMDAALLEMKRSWNRMYAIRQLRAEEEGITTPPPSPPAADTTRAEPGIIRKNARVPAPTSPISDLRLVTGSAADVVYKIVAQYPRGISQPILREEYEKTDLARTARPGTKPYYYGLQRLKMTGHVVTYKGRIFLHQHLEKFKEDVAAGRVPDLFEEKKLNSKWSLATLEYLRSQENNWVTFKKICDHIATQPEFKDSKSVRELVAVALNGLNWTHGLIEKMKVKGQKPVYRIKPEKSPAIEADETFWGAEADASTPRH